MDTKITIISSTNVPIPDYFDKERWIVIYQENGGDGVPLIVLREKPKENKMPYYDPYKGSVGTTTLPQQDTSFNPTAGTK